MNHSRTNKKKENQLKSNPPTHRVSPWSPRYSDTLDGPESQSGDPSSCCISTAIAPTKIAAISMCLAEKKVPIELVQTPTVPTRRSQRTFFSFNRRNAASGDQKRLKQKNKKE